MANMAAAVVRSLSVRIRLDADLSVASEYVLGSVLERVGVEGVKCFARVQRNNFQVAVKTPDVKEKLMLEEIEVSGRHFPVHPVERENPQHQFSAYTMLMPYEMSDQCVADALSNYGEVVSVRRLSNKRHPGIERIVRLFRLKDAEVARIPTLIQVGIYNMVVRKCGVFTVDPRLSKHLETHSCSYK